MRHKYHEDTVVPRQPENRGTAPDPRANQKERTRAALVTAAAELLRGGSAPTVAEAAEAAKVSRATAYRYFPTQEALLLEISDLATMVAPVEAALAALPADGDPEARLLQLVDGLNAVLFANEAPMRTALRAYLDAWLEGRRAGDESPAVREGRRRRYLDRVLEPVRQELTEREWHRLRAALSLTLGSEAMVVMKDVCRLGDAEALEVLRWTAAMLLRAALATAREGRASAPPQAGPALP
ncbi:TetR/AcrR family transcriptional regulator [Falsiroseomonas sp. HW251]|uniref:TetR/AcrR family transcriptional regulator n=1 Tax=Falsiroseomonas sp. HW251 TaxID=3390998 RepID=UPI003D3221DC